MRKGIILSALMIPLLLLSGCLGVGEGQKLLDQALTIRGEYLAMEGFSAQAELTADYGQRVCSYTLEVDASSDEITLTITQPDILAGITARCRNGDSFLEYDGLVIETGALNKQGLSPMSAIPAMLEQLRGGYLMAWNMEDGALRITCGDPDLGTTAAAVRAAEIGADVVLMAKNIDGIYTADPNKDPTAVKIDTISCREVLEKRLAALDSTATAFCMDHGIPVLAFGLSDPENIYRAVMGEKIGTVITGC